jgi:hypothetical protein
MGSYTREIITATQKFNENDKLREMLADFAESLFKDGLIHLSTRYDKETGEIFKVLSVQIVKENRGDE